MARVFELCALHQTKAFASIVDRDAPRATGDFLRKDYAYLFERFFYYLDSQQSHQQGLVIFDEKDSTLSHVLVDQMARYFEKTRTGKLRASRIVPEPLFVHSELTSLVQVADLIAYVIAWGVQIKDKMHKPRRPELAELAEAVCSLRFRAETDRHGSPFYVWSFAVIDDLGPYVEKIAPLEVQK